MLWVPLVLLCSAVPVLARIEEPVYRPEVQSKVLLKTSETAAGGVIAYPTSAHPEITALSVRIPPGAETGWHTHSVPGYAYILSGELTLSYGKESRVFKAGEAFAEAVDTLHNGRNKGSVEVVLVVFFTGEVGKSFTLKGPAAAPSAP